MVGILLCTYNGEAFLRSQIESFIDQTHKEWRLYVSDDGSTDGTRDILKEYMQRLGTRMVVVDGPKKGFAQNFMSLVRNQRISCDYYAFSDQDDIWLPEKLARSLAALESISPDTPCLYCSRTRLINTHGVVIGQTPLFKNRPSFRNALVQSLAGANTMVINETARKLLTRTSHQATIIAHDWLTYMIVSGCGGIVIYDPEPSLLYRQHEGNVIGANAGFSNKVRRISKMLKGRFREWNDKNLLILRGYSSELTSENRRLLGSFDRRREGNIFARISLMKTGRLYRQTIAGNISLYIALLLKQI